jgi:uncharacterized repeat protein (TIGR01451 family)
LINGKFRSIADVDPEGILAASEVDKESPASAWTVKYYKFADDSALPDTDGYTKVYDSSNSIHGSKSIRIKGRSEDSEAPASGKMQTAIVSREFDIKPSTRYMLVYSLKVDRRRCNHYDKLSDMPSGMAEQYRMRQMYCGYYKVFLDEPNSATHHMQVGFLEGREASQFWADDFLYLRRSTRDWYTEKMDFTSAKDATKAKVSIVLKAYAGDLYLDNLRLIPVGTFVSDEIASLVPVEFSGKMELQNAGAGPSSGTSNVTVNTNKAAFNFGSNFIYGKAKNGSTSTNVLSLEAGLGANPTQFGQNIFEGLTKKDSIIIGGQAKAVPNGIAFYENNYLTLTIGADSTALVKIKPTALPTDPQAFYTLRLKGEGSPMQNGTFYQNGMLYYRIANSGDASNSDKGFFFAPLLPKGDLAYKASDKENPMPVDLQRYIVGIDSVGKDILKDRWPNLTSPIDQTEFTGDWYFDYIAKSGDAFLISIFPPKDFDKKQWCSDRVTAITDTYAAYNPSASLDDMKNFTDVVARDNNALILWMGLFDTVPLDEVNFEKDTDKKYFYPNKGGEKLEGNPFDKGLPMKTRDVQGPYTPPSDPTTGEGKKLTDWIDYMHQKNLKVLFYTAPSAFYPYEAGLGLNYSRTLEVQYRDMLQDILDDYDFDGVYFDGYFTNDIMHNLTLVRLTRTLKNYKGEEVLWVQHDSNKDGYLHQMGFVGPNGDPFSGHLNFLDPDLDDMFSAFYRYPFLDAYTDIIWTGENIGHMEPQTIKNYYTGYNISNSIIDLISETRFKDEPAFDTPSKTVPQQVLTVQELINQQIQNTYARIAKYVSVNPFRVGINYKSGYLQEKNIGTVSAPLPPMDWFYKDKKKKTEPYADEIQFLDLSDYNKQLGQKCSEFCGDNICAAGEDYSTCSKDCAPKTPNILTKDAVANKLIAPATSKIANWLISGSDSRKQLFDFNLDFSQDQLRDYSYNNFPLDYSIMSSDRPKPEISGAEKFYDFNKNESGIARNTVLRAYHGSYQDFRPYKYSRRNLESIQDIDYPSWEGPVYEPTYSESKLKQTLAYGDKDFSVFANVKLTATNNGFFPMIKEGIDRYSFGWKIDGANMQLYLRVRKDYRDNAAKMETNLFEWYYSDPIAINGNFHQVGFTYKHLAGGGILKFYLDGQQVKNISNVTFLPLNQNDTTIEIGREAYQIVPTIEYEQEVTIRNRYFKGGMKYIFMSPFALSDPMILSLKESNLGAVSLTDPLFSGVDLKNVSAILADGSGSTYRTSDYKGVDIIKTQDKYSATRGSEIIITLKVQNNSGASISNIVIKDVLGAYLTYLSSSTSPAPTQTQAGTELNWTLTEPLANGSFKELIYKVKVN